MEQILCLVCGSSSELRNSFNNHIECPICGSKKIEIIKDDGTKKLLYEPATELKLSEEPFVAIEKQGIVAELYAIRGTLSLISDNIDYMRCKERFLVSKHEETYWDDLVKRKTEIWLSEWKQYEAAGWLKKKEAELMKLKKEAEALSREIQEKKSAKVGLFHRKAHEAEIVYLENEYSSKLTAIKNFTTYYEKAKKICEGRDGFFSSNLNILFGNCLGHCFSLNGKEYVLAYGGMTAFEQPKISTTCFDLIKKLQAQCDEKYEQIPGSYRKRCLLTISDVSRFLSQEEKDNWQKIQDQMAEQNKILFSAARETYKIIDFRDWRNVDLLIYYFETGRADNLKEALQLVDRQLQTNQIVEAINMASAEIGKTIRQSMEALGGALAKAFSLLSVQIQKQSEQISKQGQELQEAVSQQTAAINKFGTAQVDNQRMANALLANIDKSSAKLAEDMDRQMKEVYHIY